MRWFYLKGFWWIRADKEKDFWNVPRVSLVLRIDLIASVLHDDDTSSVSAFPCMWEWARKVEFIFKDRAIRLFWLMCSSFIKGFEWSWIPEDLTVCWRRKVALELAHNFIKNTACIFKSLCIDCFLQPSGNGLFDTILFILLPVFHEKYLVQESRN